MIEVGMSVKVIDDWEEKFEELADIRDSSNIDTPCDYEEVEKLVDNVLTVIRIDDDGDIVLDATYIFGYAMYIYKELLKEVK